MTKSLIHRVLLMSMVLTAVTIPDAGHSAVGGKDPNIGFGIVDYQQDFPSPFSCTKSPAVVVVSQDPMGGYAIVSHVVFGSTDNPELCAGGYLTQLVGRTAGTVAALTSSLPLVFPLSDDLVSWTLTGTPETGFHAERDYNNGIQYVLDLGPLGPSTTIHWAVGEHTEFFNLTFDEYNGTIAFVR